MADLDGHQAAPGSVRTEDEPQTGLEAKTKNRIKGMDDTHDIDGRPHLDPLDYDYTNFYFGSGDDAFALLEPFASWWEKVHPRGYYQFELPLHSAPSTRVDVEDTKTGETRRGLVNFASYNYLGLSYRQEVKDAIKEAVDIYGGGSSGSPILSGTTDLHRRLARAVAEFKKKEAVLIFPTGYSANVGTIAGLMRSGDLIVADQYAHASIVDGMILSKAKSRFFRHNRADAQPFLIGAEKNLLAPRSGRLLLRMHALDGHPHSGKMSASLQGTFSKP